MFGKTANDGASKPSGMDMMIKSLLTAMGVSPDALTAYIETGKQLATQFVVAMQTTATGILAIQAEQKVHREMLQEILSLARGTEYHPGMEPSKLLASPAPEKESEWIPQKQ